MSDIWCPKCGQYHASVTACWTGVAAKIDYTGAGKVNPNHDYWPKRAFASEARIKELEEAITEFCKGEAWASGLWKLQAHIKPLFDIAALKRNKP